MPQLSDLLEKKKFVKKSYRPWDLSGSGTIDNHDNVEQPNVVSKDAMSAKIESITTPKIQEKQPATEAVLPIRLVDQTDNKIDNKTGNSQVTREEQRANIQVTEKKRPDNILVTPRQQSYNQLGNISDNANNIIYLIEGIKKLTGIQKNIFLYVIDVCTARGALDTGHILSSDLAQSANCSLGSAKTSLNRIIEKRLVIRLEGKACRGGHLVLGITKEIQAAAIQAQQALFNPLKSAYSDNKTGNNSINISSYSSSSFSNNKNITTSLPDEWKKIDFEPLRNIGFSETQIKQLFESRSTTPEVVQESIKHFAFALENKEKVKDYRDPLNVLMGVMRKGQNWHETDYVSPQELALQKILEEKKRRKEKTDAMMKELIELEFPVWKKNLSEDEINQIVPAHTLKTNLTPAINASLRSYFTNTILLPRLEQDGIFIDEI